MSNNVILALDLGTTTGWAIKSSDKIISGSVSFKDTPFDCKSSRYTKFRKFLEETHKRFGIEQIIYEVVRRHIGTIAGQVYGGFMATLQTFGDDHEIEYIGTPVQTIKKFITGKGNAGKPEVIAAVKDKGHLPKDDNEADAIALLYFKLDDDIIK
jgi:Holliday junction resolvasome RuvABC endonuclease subunit